MTRNMELKLETLRNAVAEVNEVISASGNPKVKEEAVTKAVADINAQVIAEAVERLRKMAPEEMWPEYLDHRFIPVYATKTDKETGKYYIVTPEEEKAEQKPIPYAALDNAGERLSKSGNWETMLRILCESIVVRKGQSMGSAYVTRNAENKSLTAKRSQMGGHWRPGANGGFSVKQLMDMLMDVITDMIPKEYVPFMVKADLKYLEISLLNAKSPTKNEGGKISVRNPASMEKFLFTAIYTRRHKLAYEFQNKQEKEETKDTTVADSQPSEYTETPEAGPVTIKEPEVEAETTTVVEPETETVSEPVTASEDASETEAA